MTPLLSIEDLHVEFDSERGLVRAVNGVSFAMNSGETLGLVGESGCGKSVTGLSILRLVPAPPGRITGGRVLFDGRNLLECSPEELRHLRGREIGMVFQEPLSALNPVLSIGSQIVELLEAHRAASGAAARRRVIETLVAVGLPDPQRVFAAFPHQLSGGMRQRVMIAMAIALRPKLVIADEPTTALDVTVQAKILELFKQLKAEHQMTLLLISHDLAVVAALADRIAVMYAGHVVESAPTETLLRAPRHPYTRGLLDAVPGRRGRGGIPRGISGTVPDAVDVPPGCAFHPRCPRVIDVCRSEAPGPTPFGGGQQAACHHPEPGESG